MIGKLTPYPVYKDSGVPWWGEVPVHWDLTSLKRIARLRSGESITGLNIGRSGAFPVYGGNALRGYTESYTHEGDYVLIGRQGALCGNINYASGRFWASEHAVVVTLSRGQSVKWLGELLRAMDLNQYSRAAAQPGLAVERIENLAIAVPPPDEQAAIGHFLNHTDLRIRRYIRAKQKLIKLLEEQKQAVIQRAVTRGLDPDVRVRQSGITWLGDVPEHWVIQRNGSLFRERNERGDPAWPILVVSLRTGVTVGDDEGEDGRPRRLIEDRTNYKKALAGDIAYNMMRMWQGAVGVAPVDGLVSPAYVVAAPRIGIDTRFFSFLYRTEHYKSEVNRASTGIVSDRNRLYWCDFKELPASVPPFAEQQRIVEYIEHESARIDAAAHRAKREIDLIREYRTHLIADVVTGKLDVREAAARLPSAEVTDETPDADLIADEGAEPEIEDVDAALAGAEF